MKFVTRAHARVDRIACPWLVRRFVDPRAEFLFVAPDEVMAVAHAEQAMPFDVPHVELGHRGALCSFDAFIERFGLRDPALLEMARIVRGADTDDRALTAESAGLYAIASGFRALSPGTYRDDHALLEAEFPLYDALCAYCRERIDSR
jgi:hypothetical protein